MAELGEGILERCGINPIVARDVKLAEERVESLLRSVFLNWERGSDKFVVVDHACTIDIYLSEDALKLLFTQVGVQLLHGLSQLFNLDRAAPISVNFVKLPSKVHKFARVHHLDKNVETLSTEPVPTMEVLQPDQNFLANRLTCSSAVTFVGKLLLEPDMCLALDSCRSVLVLHSEHLGKQTLELWAQVGYGCIPTCLNLLKHFIPAVACERQLTSH